MNALIVLFKLEQINKTIEDMKKLCGLSEQMLEITRTTYSIQRDRGNHLHNIRNSFIVLVQMNQYRKSLYIDFVNSRIYPQLPQECKNIIINYLTL